MIRKTDHKKRAGVKSSPSDKHQSPYLTFLYALDFFRCFIIYIAFCDCAVFCFHPKPPKISWEIMSQQEMDSPI
jgi:hypothetical protein